MATATKPNPIPQLDLLAPTGWQDYHLLDSGNGRKLEQYGDFILDRPEPEAVWQPALPERRWAAAHARFIPTPETNGGHWEKLQAMPERWQMSYQNLRFWVSLSASRHVGVFPEQAAHWDWVTQKIQTANKPPRVLNLFGYTGLASLAAAAAGAQVTHLDASRKVVTWAHENQQLSKLPETSIRWMVDDALKFVQRESRRQSLYDGIILDPPKFGRGPKGEVWEFYKLIPELLEACRNALVSQPSFVVITAYAVKASALTLHYALQEAMKKFSGALQAGELLLKEESGERYISTAIYARWYAGSPRKHIDE